MRNPFFRFPRGESGECPETVNQRRCHAAEALELAQRESLPDFRLAWWHAAE